MADVKTNVQFSQVIDGFQIPALFLEENYRSALDYKPKPNDLFLVTYPKCGTTWTGNILLLILRKGQPLNSPSEMHSISPFLEMTGAKAAEDMKVPGPIKTHLPFHLAPWSKEAKYIHVVRNPKDCCVSYYHHMKDIPGHDFNGTFDEFFEMFVSGKIDFGDYFDHLLSWYPHRNDPNVLFLTYEELKEDIDSAILKMASFIDDEKYAVPIRRDPEVMNNIKKYSSFTEMKEFMNKGIEKLFNITPEEVAKSDVPEAMKKMIMNMKTNERFAEMAKNHKPNASQFVRKGIIGDWKNHLSKDQNRRLEEKFAEKTAGTAIPDLFKKHM